MDLVKKYGKYLPIALLAFIFLQSMPFKFGLVENPTTPFIFENVGEFLGLAFYSTHGGVITGVIELIAVVLVILPATRAFGAIMALGVLTGAIFFHLTAIGIPVPVETACPTDPTATIEKLNGVCVEWDESLFLMAIIGWFAAVHIAWTNRASLPLIGGPTDTSEDATDA